MTNFFTLNSKTLTKPKSRRVAAIVDRMRSSASIELSDSEENTAQDMARNAKKLSSAGKGKGNRNLRYIHLFIHHLRSLCIIFRISAGLTFSLTACLNNSLLCIFYQYSYYIN